MYLLLFFTGRWLFCLFTDLFTNLQRKAKEQSNAVMLKILNFISEYGCSDPGVLEWLSAEEHFSIPDANFKWIVTLIQKNCTREWFDLCWNFLADTVDTARYYKVNEIFRCIDFQIPFEEIEELLKNDKNITAFQIKTFREDFSRSHITMSADQFFELSERLSKESDKSMKIVVQLLDLQSQIMQLVEWKEDNEKLHSVLHDKDLQISKLLQELSGLKKSDNKKRKEIVFEQDFYMPDPVLESESIADKMDKDIEESNIAHLDNNVHEKKKIFYIPQQMITDENVIEKDNTMIKRKKLKLIDRLFQLRKRHTFDRMSEKDKRQLIIEKVIKKNMDVKYVEIIRDLLNNADVGIDFLNMLVDTDADISAYQNLMLLLSENGSTTQNVDAVVKNAVTSTDSESVSKSELNGNNETTYVDFNDFNPEEIEKSFQSVPVPYGVDDEEELEEFEEYEG